MPSDCFWQENQTLVVENLPNDEPVMLYHVSGKLIEVKKPILGKMTFTNLTDGIYILATPTERIKIVIKLVKKSKDLTNYKLVIMLYIQFMELDSTKGLFL